MDYAQPPYQPIRLWLGVSTPTPSTALCPLPTTPALSQRLRLKAPEDELIEATRAGCVVQFVAIIIVLAASVSASGLASVPAAWSRVSVLLDVHHRDVIMLHNALNHSLHSARELGVAPCSCS